MTASAGRLTYLGMVLLALVGCGLTPDKSARALDPDAAPYRVVNQVRSAPPVGSQRIVLFFVRDGALLPVPRRILGAPTPEAVLAALGAGPTPAERSQGYTSALPLDADPRLLVRERSVVRIDVPTSAGTSARSDAVLGFGQLVVTLTGLPDINGVLFQQDGKPLQVPRADGSLSAGPLSRLDYRDLIDPG